MTETENENSFSSILRDEFEKRRRSTRGYSLRQFARSLNLDPSLLSKLISGKKNVGPKLAVRLSGLLGLPSEKTWDRDQAFEQKEFLNLQLDQFQFLSDWIYYAILEATHLVDFQPSHRWLSKYFGLEETAIRNAVDRLVRMGLLEIKDGQWIDNSGSYTTTTHFPGTSDALRKRQRSVLDNAIFALENIPFEERSQSSVTFAIDSEDLPEAEKEIVAFRRRMIERFGNKEKKTNVYNLNVSLYPLGSKGEKK